MDCKNNNVITIINYKKGAWMSYLLWYKCACSDARDTFFWAGPVSSVQVLEGSAPNYVLYGMYSMSFFCSKTTKV